MMSCFFLFFFVEVVASLHIGFERSSYMVAENETSQVCVHILPNGEVDTTTIVTLQSRDGTAICKYNITLLKC